MVALPVLLAALTTMAGFLAFVFGSYLTMIREFGVFSSLGVLLALVVSLTFVPAVLSYLPPPAAERSAAGRPPRAGARVFERLGGFVMRRPRLILAVGGALAAAAIAVMPLVRREVDVLSYFSRRTEIRQAERMMKADFGGSTTVQVLVEGDVLDPRVLAEMKRMEDFLKARPNMSNVHSPVELLEEMSFALIDRRELPATREQAASLFFLLEGEPVLDQLVRPDRQEALIQGTLATMDAHQLHSLIKDTEGFIASLGEGSCGFRLSGTALIYSRLDSAIASSQLWSLLAAVALHVPVQPAAGALPGRSPDRAGAHHLHPVPAVRGHGRAGIPLDVTTVLLGSISMGMGIDYTVHFLSRYRTRTGARLGPPLRAAGHHEHYRQGHPDQRVHRVGGLPVPAAGQPGAAAQLRPADRGDHGELRGRALSLLPAVLTLGAEKLKIKAPRARPPARLGS